MYKFLTSWNPLLQSIDEKLHTFERFSRLTFYEKRFGLPSLKHNNLVLLKIID